MAMTRDNFVNEICDIVGKKVSASAASGTRLDTRVQNYYLQWAQKRIARYYNFDELNTNYESATTVASVKRYPLESGTNNLGLTRPKDIFSIRLIDGDNSRKLTRWSTRKFDRKIARPENYSEGRPRIYIKWSYSAEFFRIPDSAYTLHIRYPQWATDLTTSSQTSDFINKDHLIVTAGVLETYLALEEYESARIWFSKFKNEMKDAISVEGDIDWEPQAEIGDFDTYASGSPWTDPYGTVNDPLYGYSE